MKYIEKNGYKISEMTLGTVQLGMKYGINNAHGMPSFEESSNILRTALDKGIYSFDTANNYGESENVLGKFFSGTDAEKTIITKIGFDKKETPAEIKDSVFSQVKECTRKLCLEKLPFVLLHHEVAIGTYGKVLLDALTELKKEGMVGGVGVSFSRKEKLEEYLDNDVFDCIQIAQNIFDNNEVRTGVLKKLEQRGISVFIRSVYLQGLFFRDTNNLPEVLKPGKSALDMLHLIADDLGISMSQLALSYMRDQEGIASLVLGCETCDQLADSASLFDTPALPKAVIDKLNEISESVDPVVIRPWEWDNFGTKKVK